MIYSELENKSIALLIWNTEKEDDAHVYLGRLRQESDNVIWFNEEKNWCVSLDAEQLDDLTVVPADMKEIFLAADYFISLSMSILPNGDSQGFLPTGMKWH